MQSLEVIKERRKKWADALRSGKYEQGKGCLRNYEHFCCLGVACDLYMNETSDGEWIPYQQKIGRYSFKEHFGAVPDQVMEYFGLKNEFGLLKNSQGKTWITTLADVNDDGASFKKIADLIESDELLIAE